MAPSGRKYGHRVGDQILERVCQALVAAEDDSAAVRCYRIGGDEFAVLAPSRSAAVAALDGVRSSFAPLTVSAGVSSTSAGGCDAEDLLLRSEIAQLCAKSQGRDRTVDWAAEIDWRTAGVTVPYWADTEHLASALRDSRPGPPSTIVDHAYRDYRELLRAGWVTGAWDSMPGEPIHEDWVRPIAELAHADNLQIDHWAFLQTSYPNGIVVLRRSDGTDFPNPLEHRDRAQYARWLAEVEAELGETLRAARRRAGVDLGPADGHTLG